MSEFRQDNISGRWVIIAPERGARPHHWLHQGDTIAPAPAFDPSCPFCPGNERLLPGIIEELPADEPPGWRVRVVPNKYPALHAVEVPEPAAAGRAVTMPGFGYHEVIIETGRHDADLTTLPAADLQALMRAYRDRHAELARRPGIKSVLVFRNRGGRAGASLRHPHSQAIAIGIEPPRVVAARDWARRQYEARARCVACATIAGEAADGRRVVAQSAQFLAVVPFAAASPFEICVLPRRHQSLLSQADGLELDALGTLLQDILRRLKAALRDPPYNFVFETGSTADADAAWMHWCLRIVPHLIRPGGFELGSGLPINPSRPEDDARLLQSAPVSVAPTAG